MNTATHPFRLQRPMRMLLGLISLVLFSQGIDAIGDSILNSPHNLSASGPGGIRAVSESEVCLFCHTPHRADPDVVPLWNHALSKAAYVPYDSSTMKAAVGQPSGASKLCLSCHDGTVALGMVNTRSTPIAMQSGVTVLPAGRTRLGTDLSDDHPISFTYDAALAATDGQLRDPASLVDRVRLDGSSQVQCTSCHDPHNNQFGKFMVKDNRGSALCVSCHDMDGWNASSHAISTKTWNGSGLDPWPNSNFQTVRDNACQSCHTPHNAGIKARLLQFPEEEQNCSSCHSGTVAEKNVIADFNKLSTHPIRLTTGVHDPAEDPVNPVRRHVECGDCHNPHASNPSPAVAPNASGALAGVQGVNSSGAVVQSISREYELCFRCHADSVARGPATVNRQEVQTNLRLAFSPSNPSYHPVVAPGKNSDVPSLIAPSTPSTMIYCTDCHNSDSGPGSGGTGPNGPHGSRFSPLLERQQMVSDFGAESPSSYALCYKCHSRDSILADQSFKHHKLHVVDQQTACSTCHDAHGTTAGTHLINFNRNYVSSSSNGRLEFVDQGVRRGECSLTCHDKDHAKLGYQP